MEITTEREPLQCHIYPAVTQENYKYVVVCSNFKGKWLLSRHKARSTWETQGGHIEAGETPLDAARRELYEESGVQDAELYPVCDYLGYRGNGAAYGMVFLAVVHRMGIMPESEMEEVQVFEVLPENLTYPLVTPRLMEEAGRLLETLHRSQC
ncbi:MAG: NUDIX domain-containing protein [Lachnospiraceae bacterium]|nr:NUDIX domain-containing protein [Lachnospiraceae bacterium]